MLQFWSGKCNYYSTFKRVAKCCSIQMLFYAFNMRKMISCCIKKIRRKNKNDSVCCFTSRPTTNWVSLHSEKLNDMKIGTPLMETEKVIKNGKLLPSHNRSWRKKLFLFMITRSDHKEKERQKLVKFWSEPGHRKSKLCEIRTNLLARAASPFPFPRPQILKSKSPDNEYRFFTGLCIF